MEECEGCQRLQQELAAEMQRQAVVEQELTQMQERFTSMEQQFTNGNAHYAYYMGAMSVASRAIAACYTSLANLPVPPPPSPGNGHAQPS